MTATERTTTQVHRIWIRATPEAIWEAITTPEWAARYGYQGTVEYDLRPGGAFKAFPSEAMKAYPDVPDVIVDGEVIESDPPRRLVQTWRFLWDELKAEGPTRLTYELEPGEGGVTKLTLTHELDGAPLTAAQVGGDVPGAGGGWAEVLSDLKTLLETGKAFAE